MRVGHVNERSGPIRPTAAAELALEDVPHLCEVVSVKGKARPGLVPQKADIGLCRTIYSRMKEKLGLVVEPAHLPFHVINMLELRGMVPASLPCDVLLGNACSIRLQLLTHPITSLILDLADMRNAIFRVSLQKNQDRK